MTSREYKKWLAYKRWGLKLFLIRFILGMSIVSAVIQTVIAFGSDSYEWSWSAECYVNVFFIFTSHWLLTLPLTAIIAPIYWKYGIRKVSKYKLLKIK